MRIKWINDLVDSEGNFRPHLLPVDPTLHWANPPGDEAGTDAARLPHRHHGLEHRPNVAKDIPDGFATNVQAGHVGKLSRRPQSRQVWAPSTATRPSAHQRSGRATTKSKVCDRSGRLDDASQSPERLGTAHLRTRTPGQVSQRHAGQHHFNR